MDEIWKDIDGCGGYYQVSNMGNVRSLDKTVGNRTYRGRILKFGNHTGGYSTVALGRKKTDYVHRLVAKTFLQNPEDKKEVNHKNGNKKDNRVENLEWVTPSENQSHSKSTGLAPIGEKHPQSKLTNKQVEFIKENYKPFDPVFGAKPMSEKFGVARSIISRIANGTKRVRK